MQKKCENPVHFVDRISGESKLGLRAITEFLLRVWSIRLDQCNVFIRFLIVGASGVLINLGAMSLFLSLGGNKFIASSLSVEISIIWNFFLNNYWTFRESESTDAVHIKGMKFNAVSLLALFVSYGTFVVLMCLMPAINVYIAQFIGIVPATVVNYTLNSSWTFRKD